jgi:hypothetical protein
VEIPAVFANGPLLLVVGPRVDLPLQPLLFGQQQPTPEYGTLEFWRSRPRAPASDGGLNISAERQHAVVQQALDALDTTFRLEAIPLLSPNSPAPRFVRIERDRAGRFGWASVTPAQLARISLRVNLIHLKQNLLDSLYNMVINNPPAGRQWTEQERREIASAMNRTADDLIRMVDLFLRTHPGARPGLGQRGVRIRGTDFMLHDPGRFDAPWCADWAEAMDTWSYLVIRSRGPRHPANRYLQFAWGQSNNNGQQHNFLMIMPAGYLQNGLRLSEPGNPAVDPVILLFDPWRELLPRVYRPTPLTDGGTWAPTDVWGWDQVEPAYYFENRHNPRFREPQLGLGIRP